tara:strand:- start:527 stop:751 length:225 start_codon:yes stop_codon:yes gene_type:complete
MAATNQEQLNDLANRIARSTVAVIDTITTRGGFKGEELMTIGTLREQAIQVISLVDQLSPDNDSVENESEEKSK